MGLAILFVQLSAWRMERKERQKGGMSRKVGRQDDEEVSGRDRKGGGRTIKKYRGETERREAGR